MSLSVRNTLIGYPLIIQVKIFLSCLVIVLDTNKGDVDVILPLTLRSHVLQLLSLLRTITQSYVPVSLSLTSVKRHSSRPFLASRGLQCSRPLQFSSGYTSVSLSLSQKKICVVLLTFIRSISRESGGLFVSKWSSQIIVTLVFSSARQTSCFALTVNLV